MGHRHRRRFRLPSAASMRLWRSSHRPRVRGPKETGQRPSSMSSRPTSSPMPVCEPLTPGWGQRRPPVALTSRPAKRAGYASGGQLLGIRRGAGSSRKAGGCMSSASCGRWELTCARKRSNWRGGARRVRAGGRVVAAFSGRGRRAWRPFCWGVPGAMHAGKSPRRTHQAERRESRPSVRVATGTPLSVRMRLGQPHAVNRRVNTGLASVTRVEARAWRPRAGSDGGRRCWSGDSRSGRYQS
jgi:hypothetical protein